MRAKICVGALVATLALTACGSGPDGGGPDGGASGTGSADIHAAAVQVSECMRQRGYNMPDPTFDEHDNPRFREQDLARGADIEAYKKARQECGKPLNDAWTAAGRPNRKQEERENLLAFARCVQDKGVNVPDPDPEGGWLLDKQLLNSPAYKEAAEACRDRLPEGSKLPGFGDKKK